MISLGHMVLLGLLEKFPKMRISLLEGNAGWLPFWLGRLDDHCLRNSRQGMWFDSEALPLKPSEYFKRQIYSTFQKDFHGLEAMAKIAPDNIMWGSDYPHIDSSLDAPLQIRESVANLDHQQEQAVMGGNAVELFQLDG